MKKLILWTQNQNQNQNQEIKPKWTKLGKHLSGTYHKKRSKCPIWEGD